MCIHRVACYSSELHLVSDLHLGGPYEAISTYGRIHSALNVAVSSTRMCLSQHLTLLSTHLMFVRFTFNSFDISLTLPLLHFTFLSLYFSFI